MKRIEFGKYAGVKIDGIFELEMPSTLDHLRWASYLTAMVESNGKFGSVMNYDGTGMTVGIHQAVAVYPKMLDDNIKKNDQGEMWKLLNRIWAFPEMPRSKLCYRKGIVEDFMAEDGLVLSPHGKCLIAKTGKLATGRQIRDIFTGSFDGIMPTSGSKRRRAEDWVTIFHNLFSCHETFDVQLRFGEEYFIKRAERTKLRFCKHEFWQSNTIQSACYPKSLATVSCTELGFGWDLAMCVFWSHSVNAPGKALRVLCSAVDEVEKLGATGIMGSDVFPKILLRKLGNTNYGRWHRGIKGGRYQRTRNYAMRHWPRELFIGDTAIMP